MGCGWFDNHTYLDPAGRSAILGRDAGREGFVGRLVNHVPVRLWLYHCAGTGGPDGFARPDIIRAKTLENASYLICGSQFYRRARCRNRAGVFLPILKGRVFPQRR